jgi:hypothetical protein
LYFSILQRLGGSCILPAITIKKRTRMEQRKKEPGLGETETGGDFRSRLDEGWQRFRTTEKGRQKKPS